MNNKLAGALFIMFGMGLLGSSVEDLFNNPISMNYGSGKSILGLILGISSSIYGYKRMKMEDTIQSN